MPLLDAEIDQLTHGAECRIHFHPKEFPDIDDLVNLQAVNPGVTIAVDHTAQNADSLLTVDTSAGDITLTLPPPQNGREYQIIKTASAYSLYVVPVAPYTILGSTSGVVIVGYGTCIHFKAVTDNDWMAI